MKNKYYINAITLGGIFAAIYMILTLLSIYVLNILSIFGLMIMPIFAAYYSSKFKVKEVIMFNFATLLVCFFCAISDPFFTLLYILPTLIVGDVFGLLNHLHVKYYATLFLQAITFSVTNLLAILFAEKIYETKIIEAIIPQGYIYDNLSLCVLFILSGAEAVLSTVFVSEELIKLGFVKQRETSLELNGIISIYVLCVLSIILSFFSKNFSNLFILMSLILSIPTFFEFINKIKHKEIFLCTTLSILVVFFLIISMFNYIFIIRYTIISILLVLNIVKTIKYQYNITTRKGGR